MTDFDSVVQKIESMGGRLSGSRLLGDNSDASDWDFWMRRWKILRLCEWLSDQGIQWESPFSRGIRFSVDGKQIDVCSMFPKSRREAIRRRITDYQVIIGGY